jgi:hypothetical protein
MPNSLEASSEAESRFRIHALTRSAVIVALVATVGVQEIRVERLRANLEQARDADQEARAHERAIVDALTLRYRRLQSLLLTQQTDKRQRGRLEDAESQSLSAEAIATK